MKMYPFALCYLCRTLQRWHLATARVRADSTASAAFKWNSIELCLSGKYFTLWKRWHFSVYFLCFFFCSTNSTGFICIDLLQAIGLNIISNVISFNWYFNSFHLIFIDIYFVDFLEPLNDFNSVNKTSNKVFFCYSLHSFQLVPTSFARMSTISS